MNRISVNPESAIPSRQRIDWKKLAENSPNISEIVENFRKNKPSIPAKKSNEKRFEEDKRND